MKHVTLTLLAVLHSFCLHEICCHEDDYLHRRAAPLSAAGDLLKVSASLTGNSTDRQNSSFNISEQKLHRDQRTLYRRAGGHLSLGGTPSNHSTFYPAKSTTTTESSREIIYPFNLSMKNQKSYYRRKVFPSGDASRGEKEISGSGHVANVVTLESENSKEIKDDDNNLDYGLMTLSAAGEGSSNRTIEDSSKSSTKNVSKDEKQKTLSDQISEGKYGLIQKEIFDNVPKAPGIISYLTNSETPNDNEKSLGGLKKQEIWMAEDHLLVLKGGLTNDKNNDEDWKPIDDYEAPRRPVKIPLNPRVPPPFPVQLTENGPLQFIGHNQFSLFNPYTNETGLFTNDPSHGSDRFPQANGGDSKNIFTRPGAFKNLTKDQIHDVIPPPPWLFYNSQKDNDLLKQFPFNLPLPENKTEDFDEDDPSLFYPPPYSFVYHVNYSNLAPIGPLVPGIILPPPPNFFSVYYPEGNKKPVKTPIDVINRIKEIHLKNRLTATTISTTTAPFKSTSNAPALREFTRKPKMPSTTLSTRLHKTKPSTILHSTTTKDNLKKIQLYDTTTLKLHPVYLPSSETTSTTAVPPPVNMKPYKQDYGTQAHPIYFEYFDARTANPIKNPFIGSEFDNSFENSPTYTTTTSSTHPLPPPGFKEPSLKVHRNKKLKTFYQPKFVSSTISPHPQHVDAKYLFVTPKPELHFGNVLASPQPYPATVTPIAYNTEKPLMLKPVGRFEDEIAVIRQTLDFYNGKRYLQKAPKVKAVYEFSFEASKHKNPDYFQPMAVSYDQKNYHSSKPEISYSHISELIKNNGYYPTTTETTVKFYRTKQAAAPAPKKNSQTEASAAPQMAYGQKLRPQNVNYYVRPILSAHQTQSQKIISYPTYEPQPISDHGYRINNRNVKYRMPLQNQQQLQHHQQQQQQQFYGQASEVASLLNDTLVNYKHPQRPINPYSELIDVSRFPQNSPQLPQNAPPPYIPLPHPPQPIKHPIYPYQRPLQQQYHQQTFHQQHPLDLVKYEPPQIPQINPESVHITFYNRPMEKSDDNYYFTPRN